MNRFCHKFYVKSFKLHQIRHLRSSQPLKISSVTPYAQLMRLEKPIGSALLFLPCSWSLLLFHRPDLLVLFGVGSVLLRGAGCIINDLWDRKIDALVERTKNRPLASGAVSVTKAVTFLGVILSIGLGILLSLNGLTVLVGASSLGLVVLYPLMKRIISYPQAILGLTFNYGVLMAATASIPLSSITNFNWSADLNILMGVDPNLWIAAGCLYGGGVCWTMVYDTIYALQGLIRTNGR